MIVGERLAVYEKKIVYRTCAEYENSHWQADLGEKIMTSFRGYPKLDFAE